MTGLYGVAAALALLSAAHAALRLLQDRSLMVAASVLCMLALSAALGLTAATPAFLPTRPSHSVIAWAVCALGLLAAWSYLGVLAAVIGEARGSLTPFAIPVLGAASAALVQITLIHAERGTGSPPGLPAVAAQLVLLACYCPALYRITVLAWRCSQRIPVRHINIGMRAVASAAVAELVLIVAWSAAIIVALSGRAVAGPVTTGIALAQGIAVIPFIAGATVTAWFPVLVFTVRQGRMWSAYWRLRSLWVILSRAAPEVHLPPQPGTRFNARYRLHRRVIEIRDAELALRPYWNEEIAGRAADAARSARLSADRRDAVVEAAVIVTALDARLRGAPARAGDTSAGPVGPVPQNDLGAETARLLLVSRAIRRSPIVRGFGVRASPA